jgi:hypothetical protein
MLAATFGRLIKLKNLLQKVKNNFLFSCDPLKNSLSLKHMIKNKTFVASVHVSSLDGEAISLWNSNTMSYIDIDKAHHSITIKAEDKHEVRRKVARMIRTLQPKLQFQTSIQRKDGDNAQYYIQEIREK